MSTADIRRAARALLPEVQSRAEEISSLRRLPADLVARLKRAGVFRMSMPRARGGPEMSPREQVEVIEMLSAADASVGWCVKAGADSGFFSAFLEQSAARELYSELDCVTAGQMLPGGRAQRVAGGYRVSGRWAFACGCTHADILAAQCPVFDGDRPLTLDGSRDGMPETRVMMAPAGSWRILDTWYTTGLAGSGSHDFTAHDLFVPMEHTFSFLEPPRRSEPLYAFRAMFLANMHGVALGLARAAIDTVCTLACGEFVQSPPGSRLRDVPRVRTAVARAQMLLGAVRAYTYETLDTVWYQLASNGALTQETRLAMGLSRTHAFRTARDVAQLVFDTAGTSALYAISPFDRLLRDAVTLNQHRMLEDAFLEQLGALMFGEEPSNALM